MTDENEALTLLQKLVVKVSFDSGANGSAFIDHPFGRVPIGEDGFWTLDAAPFLQGQAGGERGRLIAEIDVFLRANATAIDGLPFGTLPIDTSPGSLWSRIQSHFARPPDMITDVAAPLIRAEWEGPD